MVEDLPPSTGAPMGAPGKTRLLNAVRSRAGLGIDVFAISL